MKKIAVLFFALSFVLGPALGAGAQVCGMADKLSGRILLQVEQNGEGWYVNPATKSRVYLGRPADALSVMRRYSLGVSDAKLASFASRAPERLSGRILLRAQGQGQAYYVNPADRKPYYLGRPEDALKVMRQLGLGITNRDISDIPVEGTAPAKPAPAPAPAPAPVPPAPPAPGGTEGNATEGVEQEVFKAINDYRLSSGLAALKWDATAADIARGHSRDMASGKVPFGHDGFEGRAAALRSALKASAVAENVAYNQGFGDPASRAVSQWLASSGHERNISGNYALSGVGVARSADGKYYFTQLFAK